MPGPAPGVQRSTAQEVSLQLLVLVSGLEKHECAYTHTHTQRQVHPAAAREALLPALLTVWGTPMFSVLLCLILFQFVKKKKFFFLCTKVTTFSSTELSPTVLKILFQSSRLGSY